MLARLQGYNRAYERRAARGGVARRWGNPPESGQGARERARRIRQVLAGQLPVDAAVYEAMFEGTVLAALEARASR